MKKLIVIRGLCLFFMVFLSLAETQIAYAQTDIPAGDVSGTWSLSNSQNGTWTYKKSMPTARTFVSGCVVDGKIYVIGGAPSLSSVTSAVEMYDPTTDTWTSLANMPSARCGHATCTFDGKIYVFGGTSPSMWSTAKKNVYVYDLKVDTWTQKADMPYANAFCGIAVVEDTIYLIGGMLSVSSPPYSTVMAYNPITESWTQKVDMPTARGSLSACVLDGKIYAIGGATEDWQVFSYKHVEVYDPLTDTWSRKQDMPTQRWGLGTCVVDGKIHAIGGSPGTAALTTNQVYVSITDTWTTKAPMQQKRCGLFVGSIGDKIYAIGGSYPDLEPTILSTVEEYNSAYHTDHTDIQTGNVSGTWTLSNSPYHINGEITIPNGETLTIEPGVDVVFTSHYKFNVQGRLLAIGTVTDSITFTAANTRIGWHGIRFVSTPNTNDSSKFVYCLFKSGKANTGVDDGPDRCGGAIYISEFDKVLISDCHFNSNMTSGERHTTGGAAIYIEYASPIITNNTFTNNSGSADGGICCAYKSEAIISKNILKNNKYRYGAILCAYTNSNKPIVCSNIIYNNNASERAAGIFIAFYSNALIINNIIIYNHAGEVGGGIGFGHSGRGIFINNTVAFNSAGNSGGGIDCYDNCDPIFINNIIYSNSANAGDQVSIYDSQSNPDFLYCNIQGGKDGFSGAGAGNNYSGIYENNIDTDPLFVDAANNDFHLLDSSPCIGAGTDSVEIDGTWYYAPSADFDGNLRPNPAGSSPDIGALESKLGNPLTRIVEDEITSPSLEGNLLGDPETRKMRIYLPPSYDQGGNFPVVYLLHALPVGETAYLIEENWLDWVGVLWSAGPDFPENGLEGMLDDLIAKGKMKEMIIVMPDASCKYVLSWYTNSVLNGNYEDYIVNDLVSYIDSHYRTIPNRDNRAMVGFCMGGYGAIKLAMKHQDVFGAAACHSGPLYFEGLKAFIPAAIAENPDGMIGPHPERPVTNLIYAGSAAFSSNLNNPPFFVDLPFEYPSGTIIDSVWNRWLEHDPFTMLSTYGSDLASLRGVYFDCGDQDEFGFNHHAEAFHQALATASIGHEYEIFAGGTHCNKLYSRLALSLSFISDVLKTGVEQKGKAEAPLAFSLSQNYPNPFNPTTSIDFDLSKTSKVTLKIFNILGEEVATLVSDMLTAGSYSFEWSRPAGIASGVYLFRLEAGEFVETKKMILMR